MSIQLIQQYHAKVEQIIRYSGSHNEGALRKPFQDLLEQYATGRHLLLMTELEYIRRNVRVRPDGTPQDPTIREKFNTYRLADYKERVIDLLQRVTTVSVETMKIIGRMP
jgi:hypothetical protein